MSGEKLIICTCGDDEGCTCLGDGGGVTINRNSSINEDVYEDGVDTGNDGE